MAKGYNYKGFFYEPYEEIEADGDNIKIFHDVVRLSDGVTVASLDWTPYALLTPTEFQLFVATGFPDRFKFRNAGGPVVREELDQLWFSIGGLL